MPALPLCHGLLRLGRSPAEKEKKSSHALHESGNKLSTLQGFPSLMGYANEGPCFPEASVLCMAKPSCMGRLPPKCRELSAGVGVWVGRGDAGGVLPTGTEPGGSGCTVLKPKLAVLSSLKEEKMSGEIRGAIAVDNGKDNFPNAIPWRLGKPATF